MPEQQPNGLFHSALDDSLDLQHSGLSLSLDELGAGFGNVRTDALDLHDMSSPLHNAPFSLADELADAFDTRDQPSGSLLAELELETGQVERNQEALSSVQSSPLSRNAKSSRATVASQSLIDDDKYATNADFEEETRELQGTARKLQDFCSVLHQHNHASAHANVDREGRIETLTSNLIRKTYE